MSWVSALLEGVADPPGTGTGAVVYGLALALIAALGGSGFQFYKFRKTRKREDDSLIAAATGEAVAAAKEMLQEYRLELQRAREEMTELRGKLDRAGERIAKLEAQLESAQEHRTQLQDELNEALERRGADAERYEQMQRRIHELEEVVRGVSDREGARDQRATGTASITEAAREGGHEGAKEGVREATRQHDKEKE